MASTKLVSISASQQASAPAAEEKFRCADIEDPTLRAEVQFHVDRIRQSIRRTAWEVVEMGRSLALMNDKLPHGRWQGVCKNDCGLDPRVALRMIAAAKFADTRLAEHQGTLENLSPVVLYRLARGDVTDCVVEQMIGQASSGKKILPADLEASLDRLRKELEAKDTRNEELESNNVQLQKDVERAERARKEAELELLQLKDQINRHDEEVERISGERRALLEDIDSYKREIEHLKAHPLEKEVPKIPKGYASLEEALKAKEKRLREISGELQKAEARVADAKRQLATLEGQRASAKASLEALDALEAETQALISKCSAAYMDTVAAAEPKAAAKFKRIGALLRKAADQIERAAERQAVRRR